MEREVVKQFLGEVVEVAKKYGLSPDLWSVRLLAPSGVWFEGCADHRLLAQEIKIRFNNYISSPDCFIEAGKSEISLME